MHWAYLAIVGVWSLGLYFTYDLLNWKLGGCWTAEMLVHIYNVQCGIYKYQIARRLKKSIFETSLSLKRQILKHDFQIFSGAQTGLLLCENN